MQCRIDLRTAAFAASVLLLSLGTAAVLAQEGGAARLSGLLGADENDGFPVADVPREFRFPDDHGPHPDYRNEWWYLTGNLEADGRRFGYQLTFFRFALTPQPPPDDSGWRSNQVWFAHFAVVDAAREAFHFFDKASRGSAGLAGARDEPFGIWLDDWQLQREPSGMWRLRAQAEAVSMLLDLVPQKPPVLNGDDGRSQKSADPRNASYYYSIPRMATAGSLTLGDDVFAVAGESWMDREWSSSALAAEQAGWDWFALQFDDDTELMFYSIRFADGGTDPLSSGTWIDSDGEGRQLGRNDVRIAETAYWQTDDGVSYPSAWTIQIPTLDLEVAIEPIVAEQELRTIVRYWEGAVDVRGRRRGAPIQGRGYVELTGYAD